jgi:peptidoglycan/LPS O-acetylase OafA/YrhL
LFYASNFLVFIKQAWQDSLSHFWSLAVEEQFYLIWPFLIFLVPLRLFKPFLLGTIILSMLYKVVASLLISNAFGDVLTIGAFDAFGFGALLAFKKVYGADHWLLNTKNLKFALPLLIMALLMYWYGYALPVSLVYPYFSILLIAKAVAGYKGMAGQVLNNPVCRYFGKISYGIYVYHNFMPWLARCFMGVESKYPIRLKPVLKNWHPSMVLLLIFEFCLLVLIASSSWYCFERPLNSLKKFF